MTTSFFISTRNPANIIMKKPTLPLLTILLLFSCHARAQYFEVTASDQKHVTIHFCLRDFAIDTVEIGGEVTHSIRSKGITAPLDYGMPDLVSFGRFVAIPQGAEAIVSANSKGGETIKGVNIAPSLGSQCENEPLRPFYKDPKIYEADALFPASALATATPLNLRGVDILHIGICPVQYNPVRGELVVHRDIEIEIQFEGGNGHFGDDRLRSPYWDPILKNNILNYANLEPIDYEKRKQEWTREGATGYEYLIITPNSNAFRSAAQELADHRMRQGIHTKVFTLAETGATTPGLFRQWIRSAYETWDIPPVAICILGEHGDDPNLFVPGFQTQHPLDNFCVSDNPYADVNNDNLPDICFSRLIAQDESQLPIFIGKQLEYEFRSPNMEPYFYTHPVVACGWHTSRWFQITIETIGGYLRRNNKLAVRIHNIYDGEPGTEWSSASGSSSVVDYFGPQGLGYIPSSPDQLGGWDTGTKERVIQAFNSGAYLIQHRDHGWTQKWYQPEIYVSDFAGIDNPGRMPFLISVNCKTGEFDAATECFTEGLIRMTRNGQNAGIVGAISPTGQSYSFANDIYLWGVWDLFDPTFLPNYGPYASHVAEWRPAFANVAGKYFLEQAVFPNTDPTMRATTYNIFHTHGDAFLSVFTEVPRSIDVSHDPTITCFSPFHITAPQGTQIALTCTRNRQVHILDVVEATGQEQEIIIAESVLPSEQILLTITGLNYLRHEEYLEMEAIDGPCVVAENYVLHGDSTIHNGQEYIMDISLKNNGLQPSLPGEATLYSSSQHFEIQVQTVQIPALQPSETAEIGTAFQFSIDAATPDGTTLPFGVRTEHDGHSYVHNFSLTSVAPKVAGVLTDIDDYSGNHDRLLDPGEHAHLTFQIFNNGHYDARHALIKLISDGYLEINSDTHAIENLHVGDTATISFDIYATWLSGEVQYTELTLLAESDGTENISTIACPIGLVAEDFEHGIHPVIWDNDPVHPWTICTTQNYEGTSCAQSGTITDDQTSTLSVTHSSNVEGRIIFGKKVSSEANYDWLKFHIDGIEKGKWSGEVYWSAASFSVHPGTHTYTWTYEKDYSVSNGMDCAWIDYITFPANLDAVSEQAQNTLTIHPNPATDMIHITLGDSERLTIEIFDEQGKLIVSEHNTTDISFKALAPGLYHIKVMQGGNCWTSSVIKM